MRRSWRPTVLARGGDTPGTPRWPKASFLRHGALAVPARGGGLAGPHRARARVSLGPQFFESERKWRGWPECPDDGQRHDGLARPARPVVDVEREPGRQVDQLRWHDRQVVPGPFAEQGEPDPGEHPGGRDAALAADPLRRPGQVRRLRLVPGQPQRDVGLHRGGQVPGAAVEVRPGAVVALLGGDPPGRGLRLLGGPDAEELPQQQVLGIHGDVGLQFALPPALVVLQAEQVIPGAGERLRRRVGGGEADLPRVRDCHRLPIPHHCRAVMNSAIPANSARTSSGIGVSARHRCAAASWAAASFSVQSLPPASSTSPAARARSSSDERVRLAQQRGQLRGGGGAGRQGGHHRQRLLPRAQVRADRLAGHRRAAPDAQQVVGELEGLPGVRAEPGQPHRHGRGRADVDRADAARAGHQRRGLVPGHLLALGQGDVVAALERQVRTLPGDQPLHRRGQAAGRPQALRGLVLQQDVLGEGQHGVPGQDRRADPVDRPRGGPVPALGVAVHDVVVQQREVVHEFHGDRGGDPAFRRGQRGPGRQQGQRRAQRLAGAARLGAAVPRGPVRGAAVGRRRHRGDAAGLAAGPAARRGVPVDARPGRGGRRRPGAPRG